ncbi:MAG TPA: RES family NAD+ phosphorylase [Rhizomicrobium sp.]|nr:RES family NAD+ phosphorylase [Rhizomicrobium sp.]
MAASDFIAGIPVIREAFPRTVRLVTTARLRESVLKALADNEQELAELAEIEAATSDRLIAQNHGIGGVAAEELIYNVPYSTIINAAFSYAKPGELNRFNDDHRAAWYAALEVTTSLAEVSFHMTEFLAQTGVFEATVEYSELFASLAGEYVDLRAHTDHLALNPNGAVGYPAGNALAAAVRARGVNGIVYPSVRHHGGTCFAVLWPHAVQSAAPGDVYRMVWRGTPTPVIAKISE